MKTAVSIPDALFEKVERLARREKRSRSELFSAALREYVRGSKARASSLFLGQDKP
jgi:metal-responsive CopG/Arc/MetJ family transcriptional regulator